MTPHPRFAPPDEIRACRKPLASGGLGSLVLDWVQAIPRTPEPGFFQMAGHLLACPPLLRSGHIRNWPAPVDFQLQPSNGGPQLLVAI